MNDHIMDIDICKKLEMYKKYGVCTDHLKKILNVYGNNIKWSVYGELRWAI